MKTIFTLLILGIATASFAQKTPEKLGEHAFKTLKLMDKLDTVDFAKRFMSLEMHHELVADSAVEERTREEVKELLAGEGKDGVLEWFKHQYRLLENMRHELGFNWSSCEFEKFEYETVEHGGINGVKGRLHFTINGVEYATRVVAILRDGKYRMISIKGFRESGEYEGASEEGSAEEIEEVGE